MSLGLAAVRQRVDQLAIGQEQIREDVSCSPAGKQRALINFAAIAWSLCGRLIPFQAIGERMCVGGREGARRVIYPRSFSSISSMPAASGGGSLRELFCNPELLGRPTAIPLPRARLAEAQSTLCRLRLILLVSGLRCAATAMTAQKAGIAIVSASRLAPSSPAVSTTGELFLSYSALTYAPLRGASYLHQSLVVLGHPALPHEYVAASPSSTRSRSVLQRASCVSGAMKPTRCIVLLFNAIVSPSITRTC